jgi:purine-binding chemotaxis protein CheW
VTGYFSASDADWGRDGPFTAMGISGIDTDASVWLLCRVADRLCALPLDHVIEIMRPLPIEPLSGMPQFLLGLCIVRGSPVPVIDAGRLLGGSDFQVGRLVTIVIGGRTIALAVEQVIGIRPIDPETLGMLPPLLQNTASDAVAAIRVLDSELLLLLDTSRIIPEALLDELNATASPA